MKTAISIPDPLFKEADDYAKDHGYSRSELYCKAVEHYLKEHPADYVTKKLDEVYSAETSELDETLSTMQQNSIEREEW